MVGPRGRTARVVLAAAGMAVVLNGCSGAGGPDDSEPSASPFSAPTRPSDQSLVGFSCVESSVSDLLVTPNSLGDPAGLLHYPASGSPRGVGVVLAHQSDAGPCSWDDWARTLAEQGYEVLAPDVSLDPMPMLGLATRTLRTEGVDEVVLIGASMGGTYVLTAARDTAPAAVIALSPPQEYDDQNAQESIGGIKVPLLLAAADGDTSFADSVHALSQKAPADTQVVIETGTEHHGIELLEMPGPVRTAVETMLADVG